MTNEQVLAQARHQLDEQWIRASEWIDGQEEGMITALLLSLRFAPQQSLRLCVQNREQGDMVLKLAVLALSELVARRYELKETP